MRTQNTAYNLLSKLYKAAPYPSVWLTKKYQTMKKRLQDKIAGSRFSLPITALLILAIWIVGGIADNGRYLNLGIFAISTYLMVELNNSNALIRVYSRMVSCTFLVVTTMLPSCSPTFLFG